MQPCPFCSMPSTVAYKSAGKSGVDCLRCGEFFLSSEAEAFLEVRPPTSCRQIANISGYIREHQGLTIFERDLDSLGDMATPSVADRGRKALLALAAEYPDPGSELCLRYLGEGDLLLLKSMLEDGNCTLERCDEDVVAALKLMGVSWAASGHEMRFLIENYLGDRGYLHPRTGPGQVITSEGWALVDDLRRGTIKSDKCFVAMSFNAELKPLFDEGLKPGIRRAGYEPLRIDRVEHNNRIDDEIIASIRRSKFLVADFTIDRGGIYFEAGFAMGLERPVIWVVEKDKLEEVHFDNRQYNFVRWSPGHLGEFAEALRNRIEATIGKGPLPPTGA